MEYDTIFKSTFEEVDSEVIKLCSVLSMQSTKLTQNFLFIIDFVLRELLNNAVEHGNKMNKEKNVKCSLSFSEKELIINVLDEGDGFDIEKYLSQTIDDKTLRIRNRGIVAISQMGFLFKSIKGSITASIKFHNRSDCIEIESIEKVGKLMEIKFENNKLICKIKTNLVATNVKAIIEEIKPALEYKNKFNVVQIDLIESKSLDSMGITFLIGIYKTLLAENKKLILSGVPDSMLQLFKIMKLDEIFEIQKS